MKIVVYTDGNLIPFLFHIFYVLRFQVSGVRNDEHRVLSLTLFGLKFRIVMSHFKWLFYLLILTCYLQ